MARCDTSDQPSALPRNSSSIVRSLQQTLAIAHSFKDIAHSTPFYITSSDASTCAVRFSLPPVPTLDVSTLALPPSISAHLSKMYRHYGSELKAVSEAKCRHMISACRQVNAHFGEPRYDSHAIRSTIHALYFRVLQEISATIIRVYQAQAQGSQQLLSLRSTIPRSMGPSNVLHSRHGKRLEQSLGYVTYRADVSLCALSSKEAQCTDTSNVRKQDDGARSNDRKTAFVSMNSPSHAYPTRYSHSGVAGQNLPSSSQAFFPTMHTDTSPKKSVAKVSPSHHDVLDIFRRLSVRSNKLDRKSKMDEQTPVPSITTPSRLKVSISSNMAQMTATTPVIPAVPSFRGVSTCSVAPRTSTLPARLELARTSTSVLLTDARQVSTPLTTSTYPPAVHNRPVRRRKIAPLPRRQPGATAIVSSPPPLQHPHGRPSTPISSWSHHAISRTPSLASLTSSAGSSSDEGPSTPPLSPTEVPDLLEQEPLSEINEYCSISHDSRSNTYHSLYPISS
ncbi:hypothetical protein EVG20_g7521 [Dentipellis fragilis]|uniref:Uncharacterized protein n=1 Tax=Dentipellis fragilis TaxID=205917 RepID=A0A4Y9YEL3_9AGAM|nr:hypothetical protein EVG20_g7521 [Dentipellis fragilis]